jgi:hypothetical protein
MQRRVDAVLDAQRIAESCRHDSDADVGTAVEVDGTADDAGLPSEVGLPYVIAEDGDIVLSRFVFARTVGAAEDGRNAKDLEEVIRSLNLFESHGP